MYGLSNSVVDKIKLQTEIIGITERRFRARRHRFAGWFQLKQAQMCAEGCEDGFLYSLLSIREKVFPTTECLV